MVRAGGRRLAAARGSLIAPCACAGHTCKSAVGTRHLSAMPGWWEPSRPAGWPIDWSAGLTRLDNGPNLMLHLPAPVQVLVLFYLISPSASYCLMELIEVSLGCCWRWEGG